MPSKKTRRTTRTSDTTGPGHPAQSVPAPAATQPTALSKIRMDTEDKLWKALRANPNSTAADLASAAGIGKSTAGKILARWAAEVSVTRTAGITRGGGRAPDLWTITDAETAADGAAHTSDTNATDQTPTTAPTASGARTNDEPTDGPTQDDEVTVDAATATDAAPQPATLPPGDSDSHDGDASDEGVQVKTPRLAPGGLRGLVEDYLRDHPSEEFSPSKIGKALNRSSGAVHNALEKLVESGTAVKTNNAPKRFTLAPTEQTSTPKPAP